MSVVCANSVKEEYAVIGVDLANKENFWKIKSINDGIFPLYAEDKKIDQFFEKSIEQENFYATYDSYAYSKADIIIVDINLDVKKNIDENNSMTNYEVNLSPFKDAISTIGENCKEDTLILVETTVPPELVKKLLSQSLKKSFKRENLIFKILELAILMKE